MPNFDQILIDIIKTRPKNRKDFIIATRITAGKFKMAPPANQKLLTAYHDLIKKQQIKRYPLIEKFLMKREIRTLSGVAPVAVLTKPYPCPGKCAYCPTEKGMPQSYLSNEPAVMRAIANDFDPYRQVQMRIRALIDNGHEPTKIELIVIGGTWSYLPKNYQTWFIRRCFQAANEFDANKIKVTETDCHSSPSLSIEQSANETAKYKIIGITVETRPDYINHRELIRLRRLGVTRVEIGVQHLDDKILKLNRRGHLIKETVAATKLLREYGFKITYHLMPGLPGSTVKKDEKVFTDLFSREEFQPDQLKIYPTVVTKGSLLYKWWKEKKYHPYSNKQLFELLLRIKKNIPPYARIIRLIRDIPEESILAGNLISNLRQDLQKKIDQEGAICQCIRCREAKNRLITTNKIKLRTISYPAAKGTEYFLSFISKDEKTLYAFLRLFLPNKKENNNRLLKKISPCAIIREIHTYGKLIPAGHHNKDAVQHLGLGKRLIKLAEKITTENNYENLAVISGVGVRDYYRRLGYTLYQTYLIKQIK